MNLECLVFSRFLLILEDDLAQVGVKTHHSFRVNDASRGQRWDDDILASLFELGNQNRFSSPGNRFGCPGLLESMNFWHCESTLFIAESIHLWTETIRRVPESTRGFEKIEATLPNVFRVDSGWNRFLESWSRLALPRFPNSDFLSVENRLACLVNCRDYRFTFLEDRRSIEHGRSIGRFSAASPKLRMLGVKLMNQLYTLTYYLFMMKNFCSKEGYSGTPRVIPESCKWIDSDVLGAKSIVDDEFVKSFNEHYSSCVGSVEGNRYRVVSPDPEDRVCHVDLDNESCIFVYEAIFTKVGIRLPFTDFEIEVLKGCEIAPSQIHPNSWGFIRGFEVICQEFGFPTSLAMFHHLFKLTKPFSKEKQQWLSFRANQNMKVFEMLEESVRDFKCLYFKVVPQAGTSPSWVDGEGEHWFPLSWNEEWVDPKVDREDLSESELLFVDTLSDCWGKKPHLPTRQLLTQLSAYIQKDILEVMSGKSSVYDKFKARLLNKSKKSANVVGTGSGSSKPTSSEQSIPTSSAISDSSSAKKPSAQEVERNKEPPQSQKRKAPEPKYGHINSKEFDHAGFAQEYLLGENIRIPMDGANFMDGENIVPEGEVDKLRGRVKVVEAEKRVIEGEKSELSSKVTRLEARLALETQDLIAARELWSKLEKEKSEMEEKYKKLYVEYKLKVESHQRLEVDLLAAQETCNKFSADAMLLAEEVTINLKEQIKVLLPDFDSDQIGPDHKVIDVIIIPSEPPSE
ncbi:hypothetical protein PIB30_049143 [Stylosanthes scabra]|uniref:Transposase (putative) gypsy type domain-containing protein n=1 Tax=Stylosanthes scabra TaxID=79078 RepID=A0ABU6YFI5_9FABA|nr:hypothetical protein [Stylosanthes scabra]